MDGVVGVERRAPKTGVPTEIQRAWIVLEFSVSSRLTLDCDITVP